MSRLIKILLILGGIILTAIAVEAVILFRSGNLPQIIPPSKTATVGQNKLVFETSTDIPGVQFGIVDKPALETFLNNRETLKFFEQTGAYQLGDLTTVPVKKIIIKLTSEKQNYMKILTKDNGTDVDLQSIGSNYDSQSQTYTLKVYYNTDFMKKDPNFDAAASSKAVNIYILQGLFVISQAKADYDVQVVLVQISSELNVENLYPFSVRI